ncbi:UNVERIFIED_CONTAM: hypothetical protein NY100_30710, partial [Prevotella sp. 15_C9]
KDDTVSFYVRAIEKKNINTNITYTWKNKVYGKFTLPFIDEASLKNAISCDVVALYLGLTPKELALRMERLEPVAMRLEVK